MKIEIYPEVQLANWKLSEITAHYNKIAEVIGAKPVKKFRDKPTAIERTLDIQTKLPEEKPEVTTGPTKKSTGKGNSKTDMNAKIVIVKQRNNQEGSIGEMMFSHIAEAGDLTVQELVDYMVANYTKPRSNVPVTAAFVINSVRYFVREGSLNFA